MLDHRIPEGAVFGDDLEILSIALLGSCRETVSGEGIGHCVERASERAMGFGRLDRFGHRPAVLDAHLLGHLLGGLPREHRERSTEK